jgi:MFS family permease
MLRRDPTSTHWIATVISGTCVAAHNSAATWMMNVVTGSPFLISLMATVASLPFFLFTLPAGVLADKVNRQKFVCGINLWLAAMAAGLEQAYRDAFNPRQ